MKSLSASIVLCALLFISCSHSSGPAEAQAQKKVSQFDRAGYCDFLIDKSGVYHAVFQEAPAIGKPTFIYYSSSTNKGANWSKPITLSNDNTGNGAAYPRIVQDGKGMIYALWKRYGKSGASYPIADVILEGTGGYTPGTIFYKVLNGGNWSQQVMLNEVEAGQVSWFPTVAPNGTVYVFWSQGSPETIKNERTSQRFADLLRMASLDGTSHSAYKDLSTPSQPAYPGGYPAKKDGGFNLGGYVDRAGKVHMIDEEVSEDEVQQIMYFDGTKSRVVYSYPKYKQGNTFNNPPHLLFDENGVDHLVFKPSSATLESEEIWDMNLATNQKNVLTSIQKEGVTISGFQASQGPNGAMAVTFEAGGYSGNIEAFGMFYSNGAWKSVGLTHNASKEKFFSRTFVGLGGYLDNVAVLTTYKSTFASVAYDAAGRKSLLMTIAGHTIGSGYSIDDPFVVYMPVDR